MSRLSHVRAQARLIFERHHPEHLDALPLILLPVIELHPKLLPGDRLPVGSSKIGGLPDLRGETWPLDDGEPMVFVAQVNLADVQPHDEDDLFPPCGLLSFFLGRQAIENANMAPDHWAVRYEPELDGLKRAAAPVPLGEYAVPPYAVTFQAGIHPWGDARETRPDGSWHSLHYDELVLDPAWQDITGGVEPSGELFLLGSTLALGVQFPEEEPDETVLLGLPSTSTTLPFVDFGNDVAFAFLIPRGALRAGDFSRVRLAYGMT
ncbi:DUF1963 domain-containing protein [Deinococcus aluminii]|uniref:DUF1963 domain-containing protein n=1 Tax=Deinococcus aluminii TaxID=1656885 RepID=A0ABP9XHD0_9DEIO